jgi:thioredoxin 2
MSKTMSACPNCHAINNVAIDKAMTKTASCGKCGTALNLQGLVSEVRGEDLMKIIRKAEVPVVVDFWADWCGPCRMYGPEFEKASTLFKGEAIFLKVNTMTEPSISQQLGIRGIPATIVFKNGQEYRRQAGAMAANQIALLWK